MSVDTAARPMAPGAVASRHRLGTALIVAAGAYLAAFALMGLVFASSPPPRLLEGLEDFERGLALYRIGFAGASLLAPALVTVLVLLLTAAGVPVASVRRSVGSVLLAAYLPFATIAYTSQYAVLPRLVARDPAMAAVWYFHDVDSIPYALDLAGYAVLGLGAVILGSAFAAWGRRWLGGWLAVMGALSVLAFGLHAAGAVAVAGVVSLTSGALTLPVIVLAVGEGRRLRSGT